MIYDTARNITWLADMNHAVTSGYAAANAGGSGSQAVDTDGRMGWDAAKLWAGNLVFGGFSDWRLPTLNPADTTCESFVSDGGIGNFPNQYYGRSCAGGELSGLFITEFGFNSNDGGSSPERPRWNRNFNLFSNVQRDGYWSGTEYFPNTTEFAWRYGTVFLNTEQFYVMKNALPSYAVAVRDGDVAAAVPEPQTLALALVALGVALVARPRRGPSGS